MASDVIRSGLCHLLKEVATKMLEEQIAKATNYLKDEKNREKVISAGIAIAQMVIKIATKKK